MSAPRLDVTADGTPIAVWVEGDGPPLVLVHGSIADHTTFDAFIAVLRVHFTCYAMDRRGFGATPDVDHYSIDRDFADVAAVVDAVALSGGPVALWGHSYGANCAMGGAGRSTNVSHLLLYEPSLGLRYPPGSIAAIEAAIDSGDYEGAVVSVLVDILDMTDEEIDAMRQSPLWATRVAAAPTIPRECWVEDGWTYQPGEFDAITAPTLLLQGSESVPGIVKATADAASAIPGSQIHLLDGHAHFAHKTEPEMVTSVIRKFLSSGRVDDRS